jgi:hypothetical protein
MTSELEAFERAQKGNLPIMRRRKARQKIAHVHAKIDSSALFAPAREKGCERVFTAPW